MWHQTAMRLKEQYSKVSVGRLCNLFGKTRHAFYDKLWYEQNKISHEQIVVEMLMEIKRDMPGAGIPTIYALLRKPLLSHGIKMGRDAIQQLRREYGLIKKPRRSYVATTDSRHRFKKYPNIIRDLKVVQPSQLWVSDITYIRVGRDFNFLSLVCDAYSRKIVGYCLYPTLAKEGPLAALLERNLDFSLAHTEKLDHSLNLLVVPIKDSVIIKKNLDKHSILALLLITDTLGKISSGSIVYFQPSDKEKHGSFPPNTFSNMFSEKAVGLDGTYKMLTVTGRWISQFKIKAGKLSSAAVVEPKNNGAKGNQKTATCVEWYLVTTYHWSDGTTTQEEEYLGTTCDDTACGDYASLCNNDGDGSGGTSSGGDPTTQQPDEVVYGEDDASISFSPNIEAGGGGPATNPISNDPNPSSPTIIDPLWGAHVSYWYNRTTHQFYLVNGKEPFPVPVSQPFTDSNGNPATLFCSCAPGWRFEWEPLNLLAMRVAWTFVGVYNYVYTTGTRSYSFDLGISKVCAAP